MIKPPGPVRYRDNLFNAMDEFVVIQEVYDVRNAKIIFWVIIFLLSAFFLFYTFFLGNSVFRSVGVTLGVGLMSLVLGIMWLIPLMNKLRFGQELRELKNSIANKYDVKADDFEIYQKEYLDYIDKRAALELNRMNKEGLPIRTGDKR